MWTQAWQLDSLLRHPDGNIQPKWHLPPLPDRKSPPTFELTNCVLKISSHANREYQILTLWLADFCVKTLKLGCYRSLSSLEMRACLNKHSCQYPTPSDSSWNPRTVVEGVAALAAAAAKVTMSMTAGAEAAGRQRQRQWPQQQMLATAQCRDSHWASLAVQLQCQPCDDETPAELWFWMAQQRTSAHWAVTLSRDSLRVPVCQLTELKPEPCLLTVCLLTAHLWGNCLASWAAVHGA